MIALTPHTRGTVLPVKAQPGARKNAVLGERAESLRVAVTAAPERGKANDELIGLLARTLLVSAADVAVVSGRTSRDKIVAVAGIDSIRAEEALARAAGGVEAR